MSRRSGHLSGHALRMLLLTSGLLLAPAAWAAGGDMPSLVHDIGISLLAAGTAAAIRVSPATFELGKMAVSPSNRGQGLGERLGRAVIEFARAEGAALVYLETNSALANAIRLYERLGFVHANRPAPSEYARADVYMELRL